MKLQHIVIVALLPLMVLSCRKKEDPPADTSDPNAALKQQIMSNYADIVFANYEDIYNLAVILDQKIDAFIASPDQQKMDDARQAWRDVREPYGQSEVFRFYGGPIDDGVGPEPYLNSWPLDEAYIDYVTGNPNAGIINEPSTYPNITSSLLLSLNLSGAEENVALGFHAIEFLLWGQDTSSTTAGTRPYTDYMTTGGTAMNQDRRGIYLGICSDLLVSFLQQLKDDWAAGNNNNYRAAFLAKDPAEAIRDMMVGMAVLSKNELAGERMYVAYDNQNQEDEQSCFSDNTHRDIITDAKGIQNVFFGTYTRVGGQVISGHGIKDLADILQPSKSSALAQLILDNETLVNSIYVPFDQAIIIPAERTVVFNAITGLSLEGDKIAELATLMGMPITL